MSNNNPSESASSGKHTEEKSDISLRELKSQKVSGKDIEEYISDELAQNFVYDIHSKVFLKEIGESLRNINFPDDTGPLTKKTKKTVENFSRSYNNTIRDLKTRICVFKRSRESLIKFLKESISKLDERSKQCSIVRLVASTVDALGSAGGLFLSSESNWAGYAFNSASAFGLIGAISTVVELSSSKTILEKLTGMIEEDYKLFVYVQKWFQKNQELDIVTQDLFPYGIDTEVALQVREASREMDNYLKIFHSVIVSNVTRNNQLLKDIDFLGSLKTFSESDVGILWWNRIIFRNHPFDLDLNRMTLQMEFGQQQLFQCISGIPLEQQRLNSLLVGGRIMLNVLTIHDAFFDLKNGAGSPHSAKLRKLMKRMKTELEIVDEALENMENTS